MNIRIVHQNASAFENMGNGKRVRLFSISLPRMRVTGFGKGEYRDRNNPWVIHCRNALLYPQDDRRRTRSYC